MQVRLLSPPRNTKGSIKCSVLTTEKSFHGNIECLVLTTGKVSKRKEMPYLAGMENLFTIVSPHTGMLALQVRTVCFYASIAQQVRALN